MSRKKNELPGASTARQVNMQTRNYDMIKKACDIFTYDYGIKMNRSRLLQIASKIYMRKIKNGSDVLSRYKEIRTGVSMSRLVFWTNGEFDALDEFISDIKFEYPGLERSSWFRAASEYLCEQLEKNPPKNEECYSEDNILEKYLKD